MAVNFSEKMDSSGNTANNKSNLSSHVDFWDSLENTTNSKYK